MSDPITPWGQVPAGRYEVYADDDDVIGLTVAHTYPHGYAIIRTDPPFMDAFDEFTLAQFIVAALNDADAHPVTDQGPDLELRKLSEAATDGPWTESLNPHCVMTFGDVPDEGYDESAFYVVDEDCGVNHPEDTAFIVAAVNFVRRLLADRGEP